MFTISVFAYTLIVLYKAWLARINSIDYEQNNINYIGCDRSSNDSYEHIRILRTYDNSLVSSSFAISKSCTVVVGPLF